MIYSKPVPKREKNIVTVVLKYTHNVLHAYIKHTQNLVFLQKMLIARKHPNVCLSVHMEVMTIPAITNVCL